MATRLYLHSGGTSPLPSLAYDAQWEQTAQAVRVPMDIITERVLATTPLTDRTVTVPITTTQQILVAQGVSRQRFPPVRTSGYVVFAVVRGLESATTINAHLAMRVRAVSPDGRELGGVWASSMGNLTELPTTAATRLIGNGTTTMASTALTIGEPWLLVWELGIHANAPTAAGSATLRIGCSAASPFAFANALTTNLNPWIGIAPDLRPVGGYTSLRGEGFSIGDRIH